MRRPPAKSLIQASMEAPHLARFTELIEKSNSLRTAIDSLLPVGIRKHVKAGPWDEVTWCLLAENNSVAAKLRQLQPTLEAHLRAKGWDIKSTRIKVIKNDNE